MLALSFSFDGYLARLAAVDEGSDDWNSLVAGMAVLRAAELCISGGSVAPQVASRAAESIGVLAKGALRSGMESILQCASTTAVDRSRRLATLILSYANALQNEAEWRVSVDVCHFASEVALATQEHDLALQAKLQEAFSLRRLSDFDGAAVLYGATKRKAQRAGERGIAWLADLGVARIAVDRGDCDLATKLLDRLIISATLARDNGALGKALLDRAAVAGMSNDPGNAILLSRDALKYLTDPRQRESTMVNISIAFREVGDTLAATYFARRVATRGIEREQRFLADVLLLNLRIDRQDMADFYAASERLRCESMTPRTTIEYMEAHARGLAELGEFADAADTVQRTISICRQYGMLDHLRRAKSAAADVAIGIVPAVYSYRPVRLPPRQEVLVRAISDCAHELAEAN